MVWPVADKHVQLSEITKKALRRALLISSRPLKRGSGRYGRLLVIGVNARLEERQNRRAHENR